MVRPPVAVDRQDRLHVKNRRLRIWIDISNTPHVLFFEPIVRELERRGHAVVLTSRRFANTQDLLRARGIRARRIGSGHDASRNELRKQISHHLRSVRLAAFARAGFDVAVSHLSFTQAAAARRLGIPIFGAIDYEYRDLMVFRHADCLMVPAVIPTGAFGRWGIPERAVRPYDGLKEHVYLDGFEPLPDVRARLGIDARQLLVTFRPIADHATYSDDSGDGLQRRLLEALATEPGVCVLVLPRTARQRRELEDVARRLPAVRLVRQAIDGPSLMCASDLVVCGGGTMLREAAVLGVPAVSIFAGPLGAVDRWLASEGRVTLVRSDDDLRRIRVERRPPRVRPPAGNGVLSQIVQGICDTAAPR
jgi:predicted glycosyltransferase